MPTPRTPYIIAGKLSSGTTNAIVRALNLTNGNAVSTAVNSAGEYAFNFADDDWSSDYANGDVVLLTALGGVIGSNSHTIDTGLTGGSVTLNITTDTDASPSLVL